MTIDMLLEEVTSIAPHDLWEELHGRIPPVIIDIREPREFKQGHIPQAQSNPIFKMISDTSELPQIRQVVLVCRTGRRSNRAIHMLKKQGFTNIRILEGGMVAWENDGLLEAVEN
jgi:SulP family sulfate permease